MLFVLETVDLELLGLHEARFSEPLANVLALISLQLQYFAVLRMFHHGTVARELLLACPHDLFQVIFRGQSLHRRQRLTSVPLLDPDVD
ncbi:hypothetical protein KGM_211525 [Danaus plexippus plexippus]|uniref:Uncharacterized protein n=1 Tax=Danaus plexippus plexippus TaxID=278856 RepID=A0A212FBK3_DANPL|nr:hypothetical protein KGM_211525 [Danaus plexippus plexippus]